MVYYTSYFAMIKKFPSSLIPISIARVTPKWLHEIPSLLMVAPSYSILSEWRMYHDEERYRERYHSEILEKINMRKFLRNVEAISHGSDVVLLCYEKMGEFCHRHLLSQWLIYHGYTSMEYEFGP